MHTKFLEKLKVACRPTKKDVGSSISNCFVLDVSSVK